MELCRECGPEDLASYFILLRNGEMKALHMHTFIRTKHRSSTYIYTRTQTTICFRTHTAKNGTNGSLLESK